MADLLSFRHPIAFSTAVVTLSLALLPTASTCLWGQTETVAAQPEPPTALPPQGPAEESATEEAEAELVLQFPPFELYSSFWINLHQTLIAKAMDRELPKLDCESAMDESSRAAWRSAAEIYGQKKERDYLFGTAETAAKARLALVGPRARLAGVDDIPPDQTSALASVAELYRRCGWPEHDQANRRWIAELEPHVKRHGDEIARRISRLVDRPWRAPVRVDSAVYGGSRGAYTTAFPPHVVISSVDPDYSGLAALEMLFHEGSHTFIELGAVGDAIIAAFDARGVQQPRRFWHAVLFWNSGTITRRVLVENGIEDYVPYARAQQVYRKAGWAPFRDLLDLHWAPVLDGQADLTKTMIKIADLIALERQDAEKKNSE